MYQPQNNIYNGGDGNYPYGNINHASVQQNPTGIPNMYNHGSYPQSTQTQPLLRPISPPDSTYNIAVKLISFFMSAAFLIAMLVLLGIGRSEDVREVCGIELWLLMLVRVIFNWLEWLIMLLSGVSSPQPGPLMIMNAIYRLAFAIAFTVVLPAAVSRGCTHVSSSWYALVVVAWIFLVIDWIGAVSQCCSSVFPGARQQR